MCAEWGYLHAMGRSAAGLPLQADDLQRDLRRWGRKTGVQPLSVHRLRKTCATLRLASGAPTESVRKLLGHSTDRVLRHYAALSDRQQAELLSRPRRLATSPSASVADLRCAALCRAANPSPAPDDPSHP